MSNKYYHTMQPADQESNKIVSNRDISTPIRNKIAKVFS